MRVGLHLYDQCGHTKDPQFLFCKIKLVDLIKSYLTGKEDVSHRPETAEEWLHTL